MLRGEACRNIYKKIVGNILGVYPRKREKKQTLIIRRNITFFFHKNKQHQFNGEYYVIKRVVVCISKPGDRNIVII